MTENKPLTWKGLVATAKTSEDIQAWVTDPLEWRQGPLNTVFDGPYDTKLSENRRKEKWVSLGLVLQQREQLRKLLDGFGSIDDYDNDDVIELIKGLREVSGEHK
jgi:hypothetical protein